jgi:hypothetical protein
MTTLPWGFGPGMSVPLHLLIHFTIAMKLASSPRRVPTTGTAGWERPG